MNAEKTTDRIINIFRENSDEIIISKFSYKDLIIIYEFLGGNESILLSKNRNKKGAVNAFSEQEPLVDNFIVGMG